MLLHAYTRIYFDDEETANQGDAILTAVEPQRRRTLIARRQPGSPPSISSTSICKGRPRPSSSISEDESMNDLTDRLRGAAGTLTSLGAQAPSCGAKRQSN